MNTTEVKSVYRHFKYSPKRIIKFACILYGDDIRTFWEQY